MSLLYPALPPSLLLPSTNRIGTSGTCSSNQFLCGGDGGGKIHGAAAAGGGGGGGIVCNNVGNSHHPEECNDSFQGVQLRVEQFISLYKYFEKNQTNPMSLLVEFYQKTPQRDQLEAGSLENPSDWFRDEQVQFPAAGPTPGQQQQTAYWHSVFQCPIFSNIQTASCLPLPLFACELGNKIWNEHELKSLISVTQDFFGSAYIVSHGLVYWRNKKSARKSCALAALLELFATTRTDSELMQHIIAKPAFAWERGQVQLLTTNTKSHCNVSSATEAKVNNFASADDLDCSRPKYPSWVNRLYDIGLQSVSLSYYQSNCPESSDDEWNLTPCPIFCRIAVHQPVKLTVQGSPCLSKKEARQSAIKELESRCFFAISPHTPEKLVKDGILKSDAKTINICSYLPSWATSSFLVDSKDSIFIMYQLVLLTASGNSWVKRQMGFDDRAQETQIGIIFPRDILADGDADDEVEFHAHFTTKGRNGAECETTTHVFLKNRKKISLKDDLSVLLKFNQFLQTSRTFGFSKKSTRPTLVDLGDVSGGRTYLFVPLDSNLEIDFAIMNNTLEGKIFPLQSSKWLTWNLPIIGMLDSRSVSGILFLTALAVFNFTWYEFLLSKFSLIVSIIALLLPFKPPQKFFNKRELANRFLIHRKILYVTEADGGPSSLTAHSPMPENEETTKDCQEKVKEACGFTFGEYYLKRFGLELRYPNENLISAYRVTKHAEHDPFDNNEPQTNSIFLVPELVYCLAPPRDFVYVINQVQKFMPELERKIDVRRLAFSVYRELADSPAEAAGVNLNMLSSLLDEATSSYPTSRFERLEFLGDCVLGLFLTVEAARMNETCTWTADDLGDFVTEFGKNTSLVDASFCIGLQRAVYCRRAKWSSAYGNITGQAGFQIDHVEIQQSLLSDVFEAFLAAIFMAFIYQKSTSYELMSRILKQAFPKFQKRLTGMPLFSSEGIVSVEGGSWDQCLRRIKNSVRKDFVLDKKLQEGQRILFERIPLQTVDDICKRSQTENDQIDVLTWCAIFNSDENLSCESEEEQLNDLSQLFHIQELEFQIGNFALRLLITLDLFNRFPNAPPGDLMLLLTSSACNEALSYLMTKNFLHEALFDPEIAQDFIAVANVADIEGQKVWNRNRGWILEGGALEFSRRSLGAGSPRYPGLFGGRLCGRTRKMPAELTDPLVFSFKALVGALVLSHGLDKAWNYLNPFFAEVLLLSAEEIRTMCDSNISRTYGPGKRIKNKSET